MESAKRLDSDGLPPHGIAWGDGIIVRGISRGPGVPVAATNPKGAPPLRVISSFRGNVAHDHKRTNAPNFRSAISKDEIILTSDLPAGESFAAVVEF